MLCQAVSFRAKARPSPVAIDATRNTLLLGATTCDDSIAAFTVTLRSGIHSPCFHVNAPCLPPRSGAAHVYALVCAGSAQVRRRKLRTVANVPAFRYKKGGAPAPPFRVFCFCCVLSARERQRSYLQSWNHQLQYLLRSIDELELHFRTYMIGNIAQVLLIRHWQNHAL